MTSPRAGSPIASNRLILASESPRRLALLAWTLLGVSALVLLLTYPVCVLVSLVGRPVDSSLWKVLLVNGLLVVALALVFFIPWIYARRSSGGRRALLGLMAACVVATGGCWC